MRRTLIRLAVVLTGLIIAPSANPQPPTVCGTLTGRDYAQMHVVVETPGHVPGTHSGCAGFPF